MLDSVRDQLDSGDVEGGIERLVRSLHELRQAQAGDWWSEFVATECRQHALYDRLGVDPFTRRCREKPRGYAGDAVMLDYIYDGLPSTEREMVGEEGRKLFGFTAGRSGSAVAVRQRRDLVAEPGNPPRVERVAAGARDLRKGRDAAGGRDQGVGASPAAPAISPWSDRRVRWPAA